MSDVSKFQVPVEMIGPALLAFYKAIHYHIPDPAPIEISARETVKLAEEVTRVVAAYLPRNPGSSASAAKPELTESFAHSLRQTGELEVFSRNVDGAPGCCVGIGDRIVCVRLAQ